MIPKCYCTIKMNGLLFKGNKLKFKWRKKNKKRHQICDSLEHDDFTSKKIALYDLYGFEWFWRESFFFFLYKTDFWFDQNNTRKFFLFSNYTFNKSMYYNLISVWLVFFFLNRSINGVGWVLLLTLKVL